MTTPEKSVAHKIGMNWAGQSSYPDGLADWRDATAPDLAGGGRTTGRLRSCGYCGSMHPADLAAALKAGATVDWADWKYGWPHKLYVEQIPNPHAGILESRLGSSHVTPTCPKTGAACEHGEQSFRAPKCECMQAGTATAGISHGVQMVRAQDGFSKSTGAPEYTWRDAGQPAAATTDGKFYTVHLQDASPEDRAVIEAAMGLTFTFDGARVSWVPVPDQAAA